MVWYNLSGVHMTLRITRAMEAGIRDHIWTLGELPNTGTEKAKAE